MYKVGVVADLSNNGSIHQSTFLKAVNDAKETLFKEKTDIEFVLENDFASFEGGQNAAQKLIDKNVDCVIGHFSSSAASGALPVYKNKNTPLFLPASTVVNLTQDYNNAFRICSNDKHLTSFIVDYFSRKNNKENLYLYRDNTIHASFLYDLLKERLSNVTELKLDEESEIKENVLYIGTYKSSVYFINELHLKDKYNCNIYFTDDALHPKLVIDTSNISNRIKIFGFDHPLNYKNASEICHRYFKRHQSFPNTYYLETYAGFEIINKLILLGKRLTISAINELSYKTVIGDFKFKKGESEVQHINMWYLENAQLKTILHDKETRFN